VKPRAAAKRAIAELAVRWKAADALALGDGAEEEPEAGVVAVAEPEAALLAVEPDAALPLAEAVAEAAPVGTPKLVTPDGMGPTGAEAEAPIPTKLPTSCPGVPVKDLAEDWKDAKVFPVAGALMAPTIPASQWGEGFSCLQ